MVRQPHKRTQKPSHECLDIGVPTYRTYVQYIPQRPSLLPGTPRDLMETLSTFHARSTPERPSEGRDHFDSSMVLAERWGIAKELWDRPWSLLSVGESQRLSLAIAYGFNRAEVLMLDGACFIINNAPLSFIFDLPGIFKNRRPGLTPHCLPWWRTRSCMRSTTRIRLSRPSSGSPIRTNKRSVSARAFCTSHQRALKSIIGSSCRGQRVGSSAWLGILI